MPSCQSLVQAFIAEIRIKLLAQGKEALLSGGRLLSYRASNHIDAMSLESPFRGCRLVADGVTRGRKYRSYRGTHDKNGGVLRRKWHYMEPVIPCIACRRCRTCVLGGS